MHYLHINAYSLEVFMVEMILPQFLQFTERILQYSREQLHSRVS